MIYRNATSVSGKLDVAKTGAACVNILFREDDSFDERDIWASLWLTEKAFDKSMKVLEDVFGWKGNNFDELNDPKRLAGIKVSLACENEEYNGKTTEKVKFINKPRGAIDDSIAAKLQERLTAYRTPRATVDIAPDASVASTGSIDNIPF